MRPELASAVSCLTVRSAKSSSPEQTERNGICAQLFQTGRLCRASPVIHIAENRESYFLLIITKNASSGTTTNGIRIIIFCCILNTSLFILNSTILITVDITDIVAKNRANIHILLLKASSCSYFEDSIAMSSAPNAFTVLASDSCTP